MAFEELGSFSVPVLWTHKKGGLPPTALRTKKFLWFLKSSRSFWYTWSQSTIFFRIAAQLCQKTSAVFHAHELTGVYDWQGREKIKPLPPREHSQFCSVVQWVALTPQSSILSSGYYLCMFPVGLLWVFHFLLPLQKHVSWWIGKTCVWMCVYMLGDLLWSGVQSRVYSSHPVFLDPLGPWMGLSGSWRWMNKWMNLVHRSLMFSIMSSEFIIFAQM